MAITTGWYGEMDKNGNGLVEPEEFDDELTEENISILIKNCKWKLQNTDDTGTIIENPIIK